MQFLQEYHSIILFKIYKKLEEILILQNSKKEKNLNLSRFLVSIIHQRIIKGRFFLLFLLIFSIKLIKIALFFIFVFIYSFF